MERILLLLVRFSVEHRWLVVILTAGVSLGGVFALQRLPIDAVPDITNKQVQINTEAAALSPEEIEKQVSWPIESSLAGIPGLLYTRSLSRNGFSQVTAVFEDGLDIYFARQQVLERLGEARESLPPEAEPRMGPISTGLGEVYMWTVSYEPPGERAPAGPGKAGWQPDGSYLTPEGQRLARDHEKAAYLREVQDWIIRPQMKGVRGVAGIDAIGGYVKQYHVQPDPLKLVSYGLTFHEVIEALERNNASVGAGYVEHKGEAYLVRASGRINRPEEIGEIVIGERKGTPIRVRDVATTGIGKELRTGSASENGEEVVVGTALMLIGGNSRTVAAAVDARIREVGPTIPPGIRLKPVLNRTKLVDATIHTVQKNLIEGAVLVIVVLLVFLGNFRAALITALSIPLAMLVTAIVMVLSGVSGNLMSLGAIDFGLIVDGAVIVVENVLRRLAGRQHALGRALTHPERLAEVTDASVEVMRPSLFGQAIIITVYVPILFLTGIEGKMFNPMALTVIFALAAALVLSLTFIPAMVAIGVTGRVKERENIVMRTARMAYEPTLRWTLRWRRAAVAAAVGLFLLSCLVFRGLGQEFVPSLDEKDLALQALRIPSIALTTSTEIQAEVERTLGRFPEVAFVFSKTGTAEMASDPMPPNVSDTFVILKPESEWRSESDLERLAEERRKSLPQAENGEEPEAGNGGEEGHEEKEVRASGHKARLVELMELELKAVPGSNYEFTQPIQMRFNELIAGVRGDLAVKVYGDDFAKMVPTAQRIARVLSDIPGAAAVKVEQTGGLPVMTIEPDREAIARYGLSVADVLDVAAISIGGREAGQVFEGDRRFDLVVRLPDEVRRDLAALAQLPVPLPSHEEEGEGEDGPAAADGVGHSGRKAPQRPGFVPLESVAKITVAEGPNQISRENGKRRVVVQANVRGRDIGSFVEEAQRRIGAEVPLPPGSWLDWGGQFENLVAARKTLTVVVPLCFLAIFLLLFAAFGDGVHALLVFTGVPLAVSGGIFSLWAAGLPFSISAAVGFIALSGVAVLNGVVMLTFINQMRAEGADLENAVIRGSFTRLRAVLMTALVAALGFVPMALATGAGAEVQRPLAIVVIGGLVTGTAFKLLVLPALYRIVEGWRRGGKPAAAVRPTA